VTVLGETADNDWAALREELLSNKETRKAYVDQKADVEKIFANASKPWYRYGRRSPGILIARTRNKYQWVFRLRMARQRATRGYGDDDLWNLNHTLAKLTVEGCRAMRKWQHGYPAEFSDEYGEGGGWERWDDILRRIEEGFQAFLDTDGFFINKPEQEAKFKDGMKLYSHWFGALWD
jgi:hypothetical protein